MKSLGIKSVFPASCKIAIVLLMTTCCSPVFSAFKDAGWGARPLGMGGAYCAVANDSDGPLYNPAGITQIDFVEAGFSYAKPFVRLEGVELDTNYSAFIIPLTKRFYTGFQWTNLAAFRQYSENTASLTFAAKIYRGISAGLNLRYLDHKYILDEYVMNDEVFKYGDSKSANTIDLGFYYLLKKQEKEEVSLGFMVKNLNQPDVGLLSKDIVPMETRAGFKYRRNGRIVFMPAIDIVYRSQQWGNDIDKTNLHCGLELLFFKEAVALRAGGNVTDITAGLGYVLKAGKISLRLDYAFLWPLQVKGSDGSHRLSLNMRFGK